MERLDFDELFEVLKGERQNFPSVPNPLPTGILLTSIVVFSMALTLHSLFAIGVFGVEQPTLHM